MDLGIILRGAENVQKHLHMAFPMLIQVGHSLDLKIYYVICPF
jgi:hypothetical protein